MYETTAECLAGGAERKERWAGVVVAAAVEFRRFGGLRVPIVHDELTPRPALNRKRALAAPASTGSSTIRGTCAVRHWLGWLVIWHSCFRSLSLSRARAHAAHALPSSHSYSQIHTGDLILYGGYGVQAAATQLHTNCPYSAVGLVRCHSRFLAGSQHM